MAKESELTKGISNDTIETYYFVMFWLVVAGTAVVIFGEVMIMMSSPRRGFSMFLRSAPALFLAVVNAMFLYIVSVRTLK